MKAKVLISGHIIDGKMADILVKKGKAEFIVDVLKEKPIEKQKAIIEKQIIEPKGKPKGRPAKVKK
jgi:hypothetical protein